MLKKYQQEYANTNKQFVFVDVEGNVLESDQNLFVIKKETSIVDFHPFFESLPSIFDSDESELDFYCLHINIQKKLFIVDVKAVVKKDGLLLIIKDLTGHYNSYQTITQTRNESVIKTERTVLKNLELQEREHFKNSFIQNFSHELRNPLTSIMVITDLLADTNLSDEQQNMLNFLKESNSNLRLMLEDTLSIGMIDAGKLQIQDQLFNMREFLELLKFTYTAKAKKKGLKFSCKLDDKIPEFVKGDRLRLFQIVTNLLDNALKYTEEGEITLRVEVNQKRANKVNIRFQVRDTGLGISEENKESIFESFHQAYTLDQKSGVGLGLTIAKKLLDLMHSDIHVQSKLGKGSLFYFDLNFAYPLFKTEELIPEPLSEVEKQSKYKVLLVEDDEYVQTTLFKILLNTGQFQIDLAFDGALVFQEVVSNNYDLILMDVNLPNLNGIQITRLIREFPFKNIKKTPIVGITARAYQENINECLDAGMQKVLVKPFEKEEFLKIIFKVLK